MKRLGRSTLKSVPEALEKAGFEREAQTVRESYIFTKGFWFLPLKKRAMFHTEMREQVESLGMTYSVCGELGSSYDSKGIAHCEGAPNSYLIRKINGKFKPVCHADCLRSCPNRRSPPCGQASLQTEFPFELKTLYKT